MAPKRNLIFSRPINILSKQIITSLCLLSLTIFSLISTASAQQKSGSFEEDASKKLWSLTNQVFDQVQERMHTANEKTFISDIFNAECKGKPALSLRQKQLQNEYDQYNSDLGLSIRGGYTSDDLKDSTDDDASAYLELSWDALKDGYQDYQYQASDLKQKVELAKLEEEVSQLVFEHRCNRFQLKEHFSALELSLTALKLELMEPVYEYEKRAYFEGWSYLDDLLVSEQDIRIAQHVLKNGKRFTQTNHTQSQLHNPPLIELDIAAIVEAIESDDTMSEINRLEAHQSSMINPYEDGASLRFFLRKEFDADSFQDDGVVAGLRFAIPLSQQLSKNDYELKHIEEEAAFATWERVARARAAYEEFREQSNRAIKQQYRFLKSQERVKRIMAYQAIDTTPELPAVIARLRTLLDASIELVRTKEVLYRKAIEVLLAARVPFKPEYITESSFNKLDYRARIGHRSLYIWSRAFNQLSNDQLLRLVDTKGMETLLLSASRKVDKAKMAEFLSLMNKKDIQVESIVGSNNWIFPERHEEAAKTTAVAMEISQRIHLDIEPQAMKAYKQNKETYLNNYISMLEKIRQSSPDGYISVAIPTNWPEDIYKKLNALVDRVYIMAYGSKKVSTITRRTKQVLAFIPLEKASLVLRLKDFPNEWKLEQAFVQLNTATGIDHFSIHHLGSLTRSLRGNP